MTRVTVHCEGEQILGFTVDGHAGYAPSGNDIVCAAVSCLSITCVNALETVANAKPLVQSNEKAGRLSIRLPDELSAQAAHDAQIILRTTLRGYRDIAQAYPKYLILFDGGNIPC